MATKKDMFSALFHELRVEDGFNVRYDMGDLTELLSSIIENGIENAIQVYQKEGDIATYTIIEGHRRFRAVELGIKQGKINKDEFKFPMVKAPKNISEENRTLKMITMNSGKPLTLLEEAMVYERMVNWGWTAADLSKKVGKSTTHISNCLSLMTSNLSVRKMIMSDEVAATLVIDLLKKMSPAEAEKELKEAKQRQIDAAIEKQKSAPSSVSKRNQSSDDSDLPGKEDNAKTSGRDTRELPESNGKAVKITKKHLNTEPKERKYTETEVKAMLAEIINDSYELYPDRITVDEWLSVKNNVNEPETVES